MGCDPFFWLHATHASARFEMQFDPFRSIGTTYSMLSGAFCAPQQTHFLPNFSREYSRTSYPKSVPR